MNLLIVIPARGGSKGIPKKNIRLLAGKPLITYSIETSKKIKQQADIVVSTDSDEIALIANKMGVLTIKRPLLLSTDYVTLDPVIYHAMTNIENVYNKKYDIVITVQPTSPLLTHVTLENAIDNLLHNNLDTLISVVNKPHLSWTKENGKVKPMYDKRLNRQYLPPNYIETGAFLITKRESVNEHSRIGNNINVYEISENESIDIDTPEDWWVAEKIIRQKRIILRVDGYTDIGLGHIYRCLILAHNLIDHKILFVLNSKSEIGIEKIKASNFPYQVIEDDDEIFSIIENYRCDIIINDILDTKAIYIKKCKELGIRVVNFEDLGQGAKYADAVINDLYEKKNELQNHYWGSNYYLIRDEFLLSKPTPFRKKVKKVLVIFGGTDPLNLTKRLINIVRSLNINLKFTFILGLGYKYKKEIYDNAQTFANIEILTDVKSMVEVMSDADVAISSQGRTMLELASMEIPTILLAQNQRELHHEFGYLYNGFLNLGLGSKVKDSTIQDTLRWVIMNNEIRLQMKIQMQKSNLKNGLNRVMRIILNTEED